MAAQRRRGFERLGATGARALGLPASRARALTLADAWRRAAGAALAERARALRVERGVLEIEVPEGRWAEALEDDLVTLAARAAALAPGLAIRKLRVRLPDGTEARAASPLGKAPEPPPDRAPRAGNDAIRPRGPGVGSPAPDRTALDRLEDLRDRYVERTRRCRTRAE